MAMLSSMLLCAAGASLPAGQSTQVVQFGSRKSDVVVHNNGAADGAPLVIVLHGWFGGVHGGFGSLCDDAKIAHWSKQYGFIGACPDGNGAGNFKLAKSWNAKGCCGQAVTQDVDDVGFIRQVVEYVKQHANVTKVYALGQSNGAMLSWRLMCEASDIFDGFAPVAGGFFADGQVGQETKYFQVAKSYTVPDGWRTTNDKCGKSGPNFPLRSVNDSDNNTADGQGANCWHAHSYQCKKPTVSTPLLYVHGEADKEEPYALDVNMWKDYGNKLLGCTSLVQKKKVGKATCAEMEGCVGGKTAFCSVADLGHDMPSKQKHGFDAVQAAWAYWHGQSF